MPDASFDAPFTPDAIPHGVLFYPCAGDDLEVPLRTFLPCVDTFWFVDTAYFKDKRTFEDTDPCEADPVIESCKSLSGDLRLVDRSVEDSPPTQREQWPSSKQTRYPWIEPVVLSEHYHHRPTDRLVTICRRRGYGVAALSKHEFEEIAVFFYRGDSKDGGRQKGCGSGTVWFNPRGEFTFNKVLDRMPNGSLVVTDGPNCSSRTYRAFSEFYTGEKKTPQVTSAQAARSARPFTDREGRTFHCLGWLPPSEFTSGPTLVWRCRQPAPPATN